MENQAIPLSTAEEKLIEIVRRLPPQHVSEVLDFAEFLERRGLRQDSEELLDADETEDDIAAADARWDALLASDESQRLLEKLADEALAQINAGHAKPIAFTDKGELAPG